MWAEIIAIGVVNLAVRFWLLPRKPMTFDSWGHLYLTIACKRERCGPFAPIHPQVAGAGELHYPLLPHWVYSHLPVAILERHNRFINPVLESLFLFGSLAFAQTAGLSGEVITAGGVLYVFTPLWFTKVAIGPRVLNFTTRMFSEILYPLSLLLLLAPLGIDQWAIVALASLMMAATMLGSKFGTQVVFLVTPLVSLFAASLLILLTLVCSIVLALLLSKGALLAQLREQGVHLAWYMTEMRAARLPMASRNSVAQLFNWRKGLSRGENIRKLVFGWTARNSFTGLVLRAPHVPAAVVLLIHLAANAELPTAWLWVPLLASGLVYLVTSLPAFLFLGEAERYISHVSIQSNLLFVSCCVASELQFLVWAAIAYGFVFALLERAILRDGLTPEISQQEECAMEYLRELEVERTVVVYPYHAVTPYRIMIETGHRTVLPWMAGAAFKKAISEIEDYPYLDIFRLDRIVELTGADLLIFPRAERAGRLTGWRAPEDWKLVENLSGDLEIYQRFS